MSGCEKKTNVRYGKKVCQAVKRKQMSERVRKHVRHCKKISVTMNEFMLDTERKLLNFSCTERMRVMHSKKLFHTLKERMPCSEGMHVRAETMNVVRHVRTNVRD
jgi:hypothetical protein